MLTNSENFEVTKFQEKDMNTDKGTPVKESGKHNSSDRFKHHM